MADNSLSMPTPLALAQEYATSGRTQVSATRKTWATANGHTQKNQEEPIKAKVVAVVVNVVEEQQVAKVKRKARAKMAKLGRLRKKPLH